MDQGLVQVEEQGVFSFWLVVNVGRRAGGQKLDVPAFPVAQGQLRGIEL